MIPFIREISEREDDGWHAPLRPSRAKAGARRNDGVWAGGALPSIVALMGEEQVWLREACYSSWFNG